MWRLLWDTLDWPIGLQAIVQTYDSFHLPSAKIPRVQVDFALTYHVGTHSNRPYHRELSAIKDASQCIFYSDFFNTDHINKGRFFVFFIPFPNFMTWQQLASLAPKGKWETSQEFFVWLCFPRKGKHETYWPADHCGTLWVSLTLTQHFKKDNETSSW